MIYIASSCTSLSLLKAHPLLRPSALLPVNCYEGQQNYRCRFKKSNNFKPYYQNIIQAKNLRNNVI